MRVLQNYVPASVLTGFYPVALIIKKERNNIFCDFVPLLLGTTEKYIEVAVTGTR